MQNYFSKKSGLVLTHVCYCNEFRRKATFFLISFLLVKKKCDLCYVLIDGN
jgi:hypothetical protein